MATPEGWLIPTMCTVYGALALFTAFVVAKNNPLWRGKALREVPPTLQDHTILRGTITALVTIVPSLLWPVVLAISIPAIAIIWIAPELRERRGHRLSGSQTERIADLERNNFISRNREHRQNVNEHHSQTGGPSIPSPAVPAVTEPPPVYTPYSPAQTARRTQWRRTRDRSAGQYCVVLNNDKTPDELLRSSGRVHMIPAR